MAVVFTVVRAWVKPEFVAALPTILTALMICI
jgi:hypothetical protein